MKKITGAQGAFIVRILMESMQSMRAAGKRLLEAGFTGERKDKLGHTRYYRDGRQIKNPNAQEKASIKAAAGQPLPAGQAPSHTDAATRVNALSKDTPPQQVKALANDLMQMDTKDLEKMAQAPKATLKKDSRDKVYEKLIKKGKARQHATGDNYGLFEIDRKHITPEIRNFLRSDKAKEHGWDSNPEETESFQLKDKSAVTGDPYDDGYILIDKRQAALARKQAYLDALHAAGKTPDSAAAEKKAKADADVENRILHYLKNNPDATATELRRFGGHNEFDENNPMANPVHAALERMQKNGQIKKAGNLFSKAEETPPAPAEEKPTPAETKAAATAEKATTSGNKKGIGEAGDLVNISTDDIHVDPHRFQYKQKLDSTTGAGDNLKNVNTFNSLFAGVIHAWKDPADGKVYVVNGHHRMELARRAGHKKMNVQMILAPDAATARSTGALINMAEGRGTALDAAKFLRESGQSIEDLKGHGVSLREKVVDNAVQLKGLSDRIFNDLSSGRLDEDKAVAIGRHLKDHNEQEQLYNHYLEQREKNNKEFSASTLDQAAQDLAKAPKQKGGGQMDLFGNTDDGKSLFLEKAELKSKIRAALTQEVNDYSVAGNARRAKNIASAGNVLQVEKNKELSKQADRIKQAFEQFQHLSGPLSDAINAHVEEYANVKGSKRAIVEKALADVRSAIQEIIDGGSQSNLRAGSQNSQSDQRAGGTGQADLPGDIRGGNAQDVGPLLFGNAQDDQPSAPTASKADEPGFTGIDAEGREWRNGELVAKQEEPKTPAAPAPAPAAGMNPETLALDALRLKGNRKPHNAAHITPDAVAGLKAKGLIDDAGKITDKGREQLYAAKNKALRKATGPKAATPATAPAAPTDLGADADALEALRLKANKKQHVAGHITPDSIASLKRQGFIDDNNRLTPAGRAHLAAKKGSQEIAAINASNDSVKPMPTGGEKYFGTGGEHAIVTLKNGKKGIIPPPMENVPGWKDYDPIEPKSFYGLTESEAVEHREAQELIRREWPKFRQEYLAKMGTFDPETGELISITCNCDDWRDQFPNYVGTNSGTIHDAASYANMRMLNEAMALMKGKGNNQFLVLGGGGGSGKGTATKDILKAGDYPVVLDSVSDDSQWTKELMDMAKSHGYGGQFVFIDRAPQDAWKDGVVKRAMESRAKFNAGDKTSLARTVPLSVAVPANLKARRAAFELLEDGQVPTMIINNNLGFGKAREVVGEEAAAYLQNGINSYNKEQLLKELEDDTYGLYESGKIPDDIAKGLITSKTIETRRLQLRSVGGSNSERPSDGRGTNTNPQGVSDQAPMDGATSQGTSSTGKSGQGEVDDLLARHLQRQGFTGFDAQGREWRNGELVAAQPEEPKQKRAAAGGEIGPNGEHYRGGAFIATTELPKRLKDKIKQAAGDGMVKVTDPETGNTTRETPPSPNLMSISASMIGTFISPRGDVNHNYLDALEDRGASYDLRTKINELARKYKAGEKWVPINDFPEVAKGNDIYRLADAGLPIHPELLKRMPEEFKDYYNYQKSNEELKNDSAREDFDKIQIGDKFKDETGKEYVIHKKGAGTVRAWPLINGEPRPSSEKKFAITAAAKQHYPDHEKNVSLEDFTQAAPAPAEQNKEIETDPARQQQIKNSIAHGELILKYGKKVSGQKYSTDELNAVVKSVNSERAKLGEPGFTGTDAEGRQWQNGELVAAKDDEPTEAPVGNTDLFGNPTKPTPKGPETMPGLFGDQVPVAPDAPTPTAGEPLPGSDNPLDRPNAGRGKEDGSQDMFGLFGPGTKAKVDAINNGPDPVTEPTTPAPEPATTQPEPEKSNKAPGVKANDVPYDLAYNAHYGTSFVPEKRAKQRQQDYVNQMQADWEHLSKFAKTPEQKNILRDEFDRYKAGYLSKYKTALHAHSRTMSTMIAGPSKFPTSRNRKAIDSADKRSQEVEEFRERALRAAAKAINPELSGSPVLSRDANAVQTLQAQLDKLTQTQELMKKMNAAYKKFLKNPDSLATSGLSEKLQQSIRKFHDAPDASQRWSWHKNPFPAYQLTNNGANIRRIQKRIDELQKMKAQPEQEIKYSGNVTVEHDPEGARIRVKFPGKPSPEVIKKIKSKGFVWSPTNGAWQRQLNNASIYATDSLMQELGHVKEAVMPDPHAEKIKLVQAIIARRGIKPPQPKAPPATKKTPEASSDADPRVKRIRELMDAYC